MNVKTRIEYDSMGEVAVPVSALYGAQTQRALENFTISSEPMPWHFIKALLMIKRGAAVANQELELLTSEHASVIIGCVDTLLEENQNEHFPVPILQTGSGTSTNMNVNEVICSLAAQRGVILSPNDHVNMGQSSNDVIPSALLISSALQTRDQTIPGIQKLIETLEHVADRYHRVIKTGRTHLMDALPIRFSDELRGWSFQLKDCVDRLIDTLARLSELPLGGTAVGSGVNCHPEFARKAIGVITEMTQFEFQPMKSKFKGISSIDTPLELSGQLKAGAVCLIKICNDLRWMNSGPNAGLQEIGLPPLQPGSSIMPDKVNPVIPEAVLMAMARILGNDTTITACAGAGNFQLNTMLPITAACLMDSGHLITNSAHLLAEKAIKNMTVNEEAIKQHLEKNPVLVTALAPIIGYLRSAEIAKRARSEGKTILEIAMEETDLDYSRLSHLLNPEHLADGGSFR